MIAYLKAISDTHPSLPRHAELHTGVQAALACTTCCVQIESREPLLELVRMRCLQAIQCNNRVDECEFCDQVAPG